MMIDFLASLTSLPNIHPALVHFPIALAFSAIAVEAASLLWRRQVWLERAATLLSGLAWLSAGGAYLAGRRAADSVGVIPARAEAVLAEHADSALWTLIVITCAAILRAAASFKDRKLVVSRLGVTRTAGVLALLAAAVLIARTAELGGSLVFQHGVAVSPSGQQPGVDREAAVVDEAPSSGENSPIEKAADGSLIWRPSARDASPLGTVLDPAKGGTFDSIRVAEPSGEEPGIRLDVSGFAVLCFPETYGDVAVEAQVDLSGFEGTFGLGHHIRSVDSGVFFTVDPTGRVALTRRDDNGGSEEFDHALAGAPIGVAAISSSVAGSHLKGRVEGQVAAHGHGSSGEAGQVGILVDGRGEIRIERIVVTPLGDG